MASGFSWQAVPLVVRVSEWVWSLCQCWLVGWLHRYAAVGLFVVSHAEQVLTLLLDASRWFMADWGWVLVNLGFPW